MLTICDRDHPLDRRGFLTLGSLGLGALSFQAISLNSLARAASQHPSLLTGKSVIFLFQQGGPSQFETFDPKPEAPQAIRTVTGTVATSLPGVRFGDALPRLSKLAHKLAVVRSFQIGNADHNIYPLVSRETLKANIGSLYSRVAGATTPDTGLPTNAFLFPQAVCSDVTKGSARGNISATGGFGSIYAPFVPGVDGHLQKDMRLQLPRNRFADRQALRESFDQLREDWEEQGSALAVDRFQSQAAKLLLSGNAAEALDLSKEDPKVVARYDTAGYTKSHNWASAQRGKDGFYTGQAKSIGKLLLLARRMCEAGCGFVTIHADYEGVWDMHADGNNLNMVDGMEAIGRPFDHAVSAFIEDVEARGLRDKILLVCCGEMGRTPKINRKGGRDHWAKLAPLMLYGGGIQGGQVVGQSTRDGGEPKSEPIKVPHLISTIMHTVFDVGKLRLQPDLSQISRLGDHPVIPGLG